MTLPIELDPEEKGREEMTNVTNEVVERVAEVIWDALIQHGGPGRTLMPWPLCPEALWCRVTARAAIEAMPPDPAKIEPATEWGTNSASVRMLPDPPSNATAGTPASSFAGDNMEADAAFIVHAVNNHDLLVEALSSAIDSMIGEGMHGIPALQIVLEKARTP